MSKTGGFKMNQRSSDCVDLFLEEVVNREVSPETRAALYGLSKSRYDEARAQMRSVVNRKPIGGVVSMTVEVNAVEDTISKSRERQLQIEDAKALFWATASRDLVQEITGLDRRRLTELRDAMGVTDKRGRGSLQPTPMEEDAIKKEWGKLDINMRIATRVVLVAGETHFHVAMVWQVVRKIMSSIQ